MTLYVLEEKRTFPFFAYYAPENEPARPFIQALWLSAAIQPVVGPPTDKWKHSPSTAIHNVHEEINVANAVGRTDSTGVLTNLEIEEKGALKLPHGDVWPFSRVVSVHRVLTVAQSTSEIGDCQNAGEPGLFLSRERLSVIDTRKLLRRMAREEELREEARFARKKDRTDLLERLLSETGQRQNNATLSSLVTATRASDATASEIQSVLSDILVRTPDRIDRKFQALMGVLVSAQTPASQSAYGALLDQALQNPDVSAADLTQMIRVQHVLLSPSVTSLERMDALSRNPKANRSHRDAAILVMGSFLSRMHGARLEASYLERMRVGASSTGGSSAAYVSALANTQLPQARQILEEISRSHPQPSVRKHAQSELKQFDPSSY